MGIRQLQVCACGVQLYRLRVGGRCVLGRSYGKDRSPRVAELTTKIDSLPTRDTSAAVLQERVNDLERRVDEQSRKWERAEEGADINVRRKHQ